MVKYKHMKNFDYRYICSDLLNSLTSKQKEIIIRRFGLRKAKKETLEVIGKDFSICRERVRQVQSASLEKISSKAEKYNEVFQAFVKYLKTFGGLRKEDFLLEELGKSGNENEVSFLLALKQPFKRINESNDFYSFWTIDKDSFDSAKKTINSLHSQLKKTKEPLTIKKLKANLKGKSLISALDISKKIEKNDQGLYGLSSWPEINPRGIKDRAYLVFKKTKKPLHFREVTELIENAHIQTVHNELIKDSRFVLVGRGTYALSEWGYSSGQVKDVISSILKQAQKALTKEEILEQVLKQRMVKQNTVLLNLNNKTRFVKDPKGRYKIKEV